VDSNRANMAVVLGTVDSNRANMAVVLGSVKCNRANMAVVLGSVDSNRANMAVVLRSVDSNRANARGLLGSVAISHILCFSPPPPPLLPSVPLFSPPTLSAQWLSLYASLALCKHTSVAGPNPHTMFP